MIKRESTHLMFCRIHQERKSKERVAFFHHSERRTIFSRVSKVIRDWIGFSLLRFVISPEKLHQPLNQ